MADILLTVGVDTSLSYAEFQSGITSLVSKINSNPPKIKIAFDIDQTAANKLKQQVSSMYTSIGKSGNGVSGTSYMQGIANGAKAANSQISATKAHLNAVNAALKEINATNTSITASYRNLSKVLGGSMATGQNASDLGAMKSKYLELQNAVESLRTSKSSATQEDINNIYETNITRKSGYPQRITLHIGYHCRYFGSQSLLQPTPAGCDAHRLEVLGNGYQPHSLAHTNRLCIGTIVYHSIGRSV